MQRVTVTLEDRHYYEVEAAQRLGEADSQSAAVRHLIDEYARLQREYEELHSEYESLEARRDDLQRQLAEANRRIDTTNEIVEYVENEKTAQERWREAGLIGKVKFTILGMPSDNSGKEAE